MNSHQSWVGIIISYPDFKAQIGLSKLPEDDRRSVAEASNRDHFFVGVKCPSFKTLFSSVKHSLIQLYALLTWHQWNFIKKIKIKLIKDSCHKVSAELHSRGNSNLLVG